MKLKIYQVDAFADSIFKGNPAAVIPLNEWLDADLLQKIAMENHLSETAFIVQSPEGYDIRWFTPEFEIDLCGHATLASAYIIKNFLQPSIETIHFSTNKAGTLKSYSKGGRYTLDFPSRIPKECSAPELLIKSLGISHIVEVLKSRDYFVVLANEDAILHAEPDFSKMKKLDAIGVILTAKGTSADVVSRCFYPGAGIDEDPVTGSAHCNIIPYWSAKLNKQKLYCRQLSKRGGELWCELKGERVLMSGNCILFMQGTIVI